MNSIENRSARIAVQLGMPHGTATNKLRKNILFSLLIRLQDNVCFKCGELILSANDLSIEHKEPWEGRDAKLFWDLNNVAFSHLNCNRPHIRRGGTPKRIVAPEGQAWCSTHQKFLSVESFSKHSNTWDGVRKECRECEKNYKNSIRSVAGNGA